MMVDKVNRSDSGKYTVYAENSSGVKTATITVKILDTPSAPINTKVQEITKESVTLSWEPPALDGSCLRTWWSFERKSWFRGSRYSPLSLWPYVSYRDTQDMIIKGSFIIIHIIYITAP